MQTAILRFRKALEPPSASAGSLLQTPSSSYMLVVGPCELTARCSARPCGTVGALDGGDAARAVEVLDEALGLWRGHPWRRCALSTSHRPRFAGSRSCAWLHSNSRRRGASARTPGAADRGAGGVSAHPAEHSARPGPSMSAIQTQYGDDAVDRRGLTHQFEPQRVRRQDPRAVDIVGTRSARGPIIPGYSGWIARMRDASGELLPFPRTDET